MPDPSADDSITKSEAATLYRRSERSLSRDITNAIKQQDAAVLDNIALRLEDGTRRPGRELTIKEIVELRDRGFNPTWLLSQQWLHQTYGRRNEPSTGSEVAGSVEESAEPALPSMQDITKTHLSDNSTEHVAVLAAKNDALERMNSDLKSQTLRLEKELDRRAEERREENELQKQNNVLMQQVYDLLSKMQQTPGRINILNQAREIPSVIPDSVGSQERSTIVVATEPKIDREGTAAKGERTPKTKKTAAPRKKPLAKRSSTRVKQPKASGGDGRRRTGTAVGKYLPTFDRAVRSLFRK